MYNGFIIYNKINGADGVDRDASATNKSFTHLTFAVTLTLFGLIKKNLLVNENHSVKILQTGRMNLG